MAGDSRKAFHFDLSTEELRKRGLEKSAYTLIKNFLLAHGFEHIQYSGYRSREPMTVGKVTGLFVKFADTFPWFEECAQHAEVTEVGERYDIMSEIRQYREKYEPTKQVRHTSPSLDAKIEQVTGQHQSREDSSRPSPDRSTPER